MRKIMMSILLVALVNFCEAQYNPRPTKSRFYESKHSTFQVKAGDILVYNVYEKGKTYDLILTVKNYGDEISYDYNIPGKNEAGTINLENNAVNSSTSYSMFNNKSNPALNNKSAIWLSKQNWRDLASVDKKTTMSLGGASETFIHERASTLKIKYKGKDKIITIYDITNDSPKSTKNFSVLSDEKNPLIVKVDAGLKLTLREVR